MKNKSNSKKSSPKSPGTAPQKVRKTSTAKRGRTAKPSSGARSEKGKKPRGRKRTSTVPAPKKDVGPIRLNRFIARSGVCSRRKADEYILEGRVKVNGETVRELGTKVTSADQVSVGGKDIHTVSSLYLLVNKPKNTISTVSDDRGRQTIIDLITRPELHPGLFPVGRLDRDTTGAILLTTDGELANRLMHPRWNVEKIYVAHTKAPVGDADLSKLRAGVELDDGVAKADHVDCPDPADRTRVAVQIHEGRNRQVHRMFEALGHEVVRLDRIRYAGLTLEDLRRGRWRRLTASEVQRLRKLVRL